MILTPDRIHEEELLDAGAGSDDDVAANLSDLRRINRLLGGTRVVRKALESSLDGSAPEMLSLLDVGTGSADIPAEIARRWTRRGTRGTFVSLDISERNLRVARSRLGVDPAVTLVRADAMQLPFATGSFDFVIASQFLHHFTNNEVVRLLVEFARVARRAVVISDLVRNLVPYWFIRMTGPMLTTSFLTRNDGPLSVLRAFTAPELRELATEAGLTHSTVERVFPYRLMLVASVADH